MLRARATRAGARHQSRAASSAHRHARQGKPHLLPLDRASRLLCADRGRSSPWRGSRAHRPHLRPAMAATPGRERCPLATPSPPCAAPGSSGRAERGDDGAGTHEELLELGRQIVGAVRDVQVADDEYEHGGTACRAWRAAERGEEPGEVGVGDEDARGRVVEAVAACVGVRAVCKLVELARAGSWIECEAWEQAGERTLSDEERQRSNGLVCALA